MLYCVQLHAKRDVQGYGNLQAPELATCQAPVSSPVVTCSVPIPKPTTCGIPNTQDIGLLAAPQAGALGLATPPVGDQHHPGYQPPAGPPLPR